MKTQQLTQLIPMNLQMFAEGAGTGAPNPNPADPANPEGDKPIEITPEIQEIINTSVGARASQMKKKHEAELAALKSQFELDTQAQIQAALKKQQMSPEDAANAELEAARQELAKQQQEFAQQQLSFYAKEKLLELGIKDEKAASLLLGADEATIDSNYEALKSILNATVKEQVQSALKSKTPPAGTNSKGAKSVGARMAEEKNKSTQNEENQKALNNFWS